MLLNLNVDKCPFHTVFADSSKQEWILKVSPFVAINLDGSKHLHTRNRSKYGDAETLCYLDGVHQGRGRGLH